MGASTPITEHWHELVTVSLLGTDRRDPPPAPAGPLADLIDDSLRDTPSARMLVHVAATVAARRAGLRPGPPVASLEEAAPDDRALLPPAAARRWSEIVREWAVLEDEWIVTVGRRGWRLPPDVLVGLLHRHRGDGGRRTRVIAIGGPLVEWLLQHQPQLAPSGRARPAADQDGQTGLDDLPGLAVPPELLGALGAGAAAVVPAVVHGFAASTYTIAHANVLVNFVARCRRDVLAALADGLRGIDPALPTAGLAHSLAELAETRRAMLDELESP